MFCFWLCVLCLCTHYIIQKACVSCSFCVSLLSDTLPYTCLTYLPPQRRTFHSTSGSTSQKILLTYFPHRHPMSNLVFAHGYKTAYDALTSSIPVRPHSYCCCSWYTHHAPFHRFCRSLRFPCCRMLGAAYSLRRTSTLRHTLPAATLQY